MKVLPFWLRYVLYSVTQNTGNYLERKKDMTFWEKRAAVIYTRLNLFGISFDEESGHIHSTAHASKDFY